MFGRVMADMSDNCRLVPREAFRGDSLSGFVLPTEIPYVVLQSPMKTHIFTDQAYISIAGTATNQAKKTVGRLDYAKYDVDAVAFETAAGMVDYDCTLSFRIGPHVISIDVMKDSQPVAMRVYLCLVALCKQQQKNLRYLTFAKSMPGMHIHLPSGADPAAATTAALSSWVNFAIQSYDPENYGAIFQQFFP